MANIIILPYTPVTYHRTPKRHHWRRYTTTMTIHTNQKKIHSSASCSFIVHNSTSSLPDVVNDCLNHRNDTIVNLNDDMKLMCKEIAHSLRRVADQVDRKYCQVSAKFSLFDLFTYAFSFLF